MRALAVRGFFKVWVITGAYTRWQRGTDWPLSRLLTSRTPTRGSLFWLSFALTITTLLESLVMGTFEIIRLTVVLPFRVFSKAKDGLLNVHDAGGSVAGYSESLTEKTDHEL